MIRMKKCHNNMCQTGNPDHLFLSCIAMLLDFKTQLNMKHNGENEMG